MGAFAASKNTVQGVAPTVVATGAQDLGSIRIGMDGLAGNFEAGVFTIDLPAGVEWSSTLATNAIVTAINASPIASATNAGVVRSGSRTMTIELATVSTTATGDMILPVRANVTSLGTGDIVATITDVSTGVTSGQLAIGKFSVGSASARALSAPSKSGSDTFGIIRITENAAGALATGDTVEIQLPQKMEWASTIASATTVTGGGNLVYTSGSGARKAVFTVATASTATGIYDIATPVVIETDAKLGDINVTISGTGNLETTTLKIGALKDYEAGVVAKSSKELLAGRSDVNAGVIEVSEGLAGSILTSRDIIFKLPSGVKFTTGQVPNISNISGSAIITSAGTVNTDRNEFTIRASGISTSATKFEVKDIQLDVAANYVGDVKVTVSGAAGVTGEAVIATVKAPVTVEATSLTDVEIGKQAQPIGDILIKENVREALIDGGNIVLRLPENAEWGSLPTVEVVEGDVDLGTIARSGRNLTIPVDSSGSVASTIKISKATVTTNRSIAEGDIKITIAGSTTLADDSDALVEAAARMANRNTVASFKVATVVTPAGENVVKPVVMTVGSTVYAIDGVEMTMDVAPYIKDSRTYFPVRYVAQAVGITADNVVWDGAQRTVTIFRANRIVQVTIGSTTMLVNGVPLTMDVAPEITAERTMLPIRFVAQGLGVNVDWDAATQTVTLN